VAAAPAAAAAGAAPAAAAAVAPAVAAAAVAVPATAPVRTAPGPTGNVPEPKKGAPEKHRLLALVPPEGIQRVEREQGDRINVWPHLLIEEFVAMFIVLAALTLFSTFINAPLRELANPNLTPNPSKAPWYFLGLQELLRYFHPMIAGITIPTFILVGLAAVPYLDRNPSIKPGDRKIAITLFTMLFMFGATLTIIGSFFRGPGYNWIWPWSQGVFFEL
jgi:quinol-cytochrome oxidoreductase complex cytochrome b subunit